MSFRPSIIFEVPQSTLRTYNCKDAIATWWCHRELTQELREERMLEFYEQLVIPLASVVRQMERNGVWVDQAKKAELQTTLKNYVTEFSHICKTLAGESFNPASPKQVGDYITKELNIKVGKRTTTGRVSSGADVVISAFLKTQSPVLEAVLKFRAASKLLSTYISNVYIHNDGRVRTRLLVHGTATGRPASREPNLLNIPRPNRELNINLRDMYAAPPGRMLVEIDASQIEARMMAILSDCKALIQTFAEGGDVHKLNASYIFNKRPEDVTKDERQLGKAICYTIHYGGGSKAVQQAVLEDFWVLLPMALIEQMIDNYKRARYEVFNWAQQTNQKAMTTRKITNIYGRTRRLFGHAATLYGLSLNTPMQSGVADLMNTAIVRIFWRLQREFPSALLLLNIYDSFLVECTKGDELAVGALVKEEIEKPVPIDGELHIFPAEVKVGTHWGSLQKTGV